MSNNTSLRRSISNLVNSINITDSYVIEGVCQLLNIKYPLEEVVQNDLIFSEAVETVYAIQKRYASGVDKKWVEVQLKSYEAIGLIKFKEITEKDIIIKAAQKFSAEYVEYDFKNPVNTISQMSRIIDKLLHIIKGDNK